MRRARAFLHRVNPGMVLMWRLGLGRMINIWPSQAGRILVLAHKGRRSGRVYRTPLNYAPAPDRDDEVYCVAGFGPRTDWYRNLLADPLVELWLPGGRWQAVARDAEADVDRIQRVRDVLRASGFAANVAGVRLDRLDDAQLAEVTADYRLVHLRRSGEDPGTSPAPGDLAWTWLPALAAVVAGAAAAAGVVTARRHRRTSP